jgi:hypothetical protein
LTVLQLGFLKTNWKPFSRRKRGEEGSSATDSVTDLTDLTDLMEVGKKEKGRKIF